MSTNAHSPVNRFSAVRPARVNLCSVPLSQLSAADQELVADVLAWMQFIDEHRPKAAQKGLTCPKDDEPLTWDNVRRAYTCDSCGWSEPTSKTAS
jgi:hypothetical protein